MGRFAEVSGNMEFINSREELNFQHGVCVSILIVIPYLSSRT